MSSMKEHLEAVMARLRSCPASAETHGVRRGLLEEIDALFGEARSELDATLGEYYRACCQRVADEIRSWHGSGARLWKLYSSGIIVKDASGRVYGFDVNDGCTPSGVYRTRLRLDGETAASLADVVDTMFYTHAHEDHVGTLVADAMLSRGKAVVAPQDAIDSWCLDGAVPAETYCAAGVSCYGGHQGPVLPNFAYAVRLDCGRTVFVRGDMYNGEEFSPILDRMASSGVVPDCVLMCAYTNTPPEPLPEVRRHFPRAVIVPLHEWEFTHRKLGALGAATQSYGELYRLFAEPASAGLCRIVTWGESLEI